MYVVINSNGVLCIRPCNINWYINAPASLNFPSVAYNIIYMTLTLILYSQLCAYNTHAFSTGNLGTTELSLVIEYAHIL